MSLQATRAEDWRAAMMHGVRIGAAAREQRLVDEAVLVRDADEDGSAGSFAQDLAWRALSFADRLRIPGLARVWHHHAFELDAEAGSQRAHDPVTLLAAFAALVARYSGETSFCLGADLADGSGEREVPVAAEFGAPASSFLAQLRAACAEHTSTTLDAQLSRFSATFVWDPSGTPFCDMAPSDHHRGDLTLYAHPTSTGVRALFAFDGNLFESATIERLSESLRLLGEGLRESPEQPIGELPLLSEADTSRLLALWTGPMAEEEQRPLHHLVLEHGRRNPNTIAVTFRDQQLTYGELEQRSLVLASRLLQAGVSRGARVAVCLEPALETVVCLMGVLRSGATYVPLDPSYPRDRLELMLHDTDAQVLLTQSWLLEDLPSTANTWCVDDAGFAEATGLVSSDEIECKVFLDQVAYVIYTSGTTGTPKGVMVSHRNLAHYVLSAQRRYGFCAKDVMPAMARSTFSITMLEMFSTLSVGGRLIVLERDHVLDFRRLSETLRGSTVLHASPSLLRKFVAFVREQGIDPADFDGLRHVSSGGDLVSGDLLESLKSIFRRAELFVIYGCSEISCMGCTFEVPRDGRVTKTMVGRPFENMAVRLLDPRQQPVPPGVVGEIYFGGLGVSLGYLGRLELTCEKFIEIDGQRFYRTGDLGRSDGQGQIEILGRSDFQLKLRGIRIEPGEIESTLRAQEGVREAVVTAKDLGSGEASLVAYVVLDERDEPLGARLRGLRKACRSRLPDYMVPTVFVSLSKLPVNMNQKVDRKALPMPTPDDVEMLRDFVPPQTPTQGRLVEIWERVLGAQRTLGIRDSFFDVGGSSLLSVTLMMEIERAFGRSLPLSTLLTEPTIETLAEALDGPANIVRDSIVILRDGGDEAPLFLVHDGEGEIMPYLNLARMLKPTRKVYGVQPHATIDHPMLHSRLSEVVEHYVRVIRDKQPEGPYFLGGLCIGGFIALEIGRRLQELGETVAQVFLLDAAHVHATPKSKNEERLDRLRSALGHSASAPTRSWLDRSRVLIRTAYQKGENLLSYELSVRSKRSRDNTRMRLFRAYLDRGLSMPEFLRHIPVQVVLRFAEREYVNREPYRGEVVLIRATRKSEALAATAIDDTPYVECFASPLLGWEGKLESLKIFDVAGGHSSMLQEPFVEDLAGVVQARIDARTSELSQGGSPVRASRESLQV